MKRYFSNIAVIGLASVVCTSMLLVFSHLTLANPYFNLAAMHYPFVLGY